MPSPCEADPRGSQAKRRRDRLRPRRRHRRDEKVGRDAEREGANGKGDVCGKRRGLGSVVLAERGLVATHAVRTESIARRSLREGVHPEEGADRECADPNATEDPCCLPPPATRWYGIRD